MTALFGMATKYSEALLGAKYRHVDAAGERSGGPAFYLTNGIGSPVGRTLGVLFAIFAAIAAFGIGNMVQSNATSSSIETATGGAVPAWITGIVLTVLAALVILGGIAAAAAQTTHPVRQAMVSMTQTFIDTIAVCSFTGLAIVTTGVWQSGGDGGDFTQRAFESALGSVGPTLVALGLAFFSFSTLLGWAYYGERNLEYLFGRVAVFPYRLVFIVAIFVGSTLTLEGPFLFSDVANGLMALPNLIGLLLLSRIILRETRSYFNGSGSPERTRR